ncbi:MAG TPA: RNA polymerase sigma factor [Chthonomonadaceae bacterium]|nr:RNA polymerase sigma factor [Chthonomonadaceae bacterium]
MWEPSDIELMLRVKAGDMVAFRQLTARHRDTLLRFFRAILDDRSLAEDYTQETFLRLWFARERYEPTGKFSTYLFQIGKHYWLNQRKKVRLPTTPADDALQIVAAPPDAEPETVLLRQTRQERIRQALAAMPEHYRAVFVLSHFEGLTYAEIGCRLGIPVGTVKSRMAEAVRRLRAALSEGDF